MAQKSLAEELESKPGLLNVKELSQILGLHSETWRQQTRTVLIVYTSKE